MPLALVGVRAPSLFTALPVVETAVLATRLPEWPGADAEPIKSAMENDPKEESLRPTSPGRSMSKGSRCGDESGPELSATLDEEKEFDMLLFISAPPGVGGAEEPGEKIGLTASECAVEGIGVMRAFISSRKRCRTRSVMLPTTCSAEQIDGSLSVRV